MVVSAPGPEMSFTLDSDGISAGAVFGAAFVRNASIGLLLAAGASTVRVREFVNRRDGATEAVNYTS